MKKELEDLRAIREMMERSSKFLSLSGLSGVIAGITAIAGAAFAYFFLLRDPSLTHFNRMQEAMILLGTAMSVLVISIGCGVLLSWRKARKNNYKLMDKVAAKTLYNLFIPLAAGGILALIFLLRGDVSSVISITLIFYGLALVNASKYTFEEVHYLGITEIVLGILSAIFLHNGLLFWTLGFGLCHIVYGLIMYFKYDARKA